MGVEHGDILGGVLIEPHDLADDEGAIDGGLLGDLGPQLGDALRDLRAAKEVPRLALDLLAMRLQLEAGEAIGVDRRAATDDIQAGLLLGLSEPVGLSWHGVAP